MTVNVAVIIPFFQRERGLLLRALNSVASQKLADDVRLKIIVVDDQSPLPLEDALEGFVPPLPHQLVTLSRTNGGPGAARNTALNSINPSEIDFVAFLDSDDFWFENHISTALRFLHQGADFYFCNSVHDNTNSFSFYIYMRSNHNIYDIHDGISKSISGQEAFDAFIKECIPHTSQVVYDFKMHRHVRFDEDQRRAGEDHMFWIELAQGSSKVSYSTSVMGNRGRGVSIYRETLSWDSVSGPDRVIDEIVFRRKITRLRGVTLENIEELRLYGRKLCDHLLFLCLRNMRYRPLVTARAIARISREIPVFWLYLPMTICRLPSHVATLRNEAARLQAGPADVGVSEAP